MARQKSYYINVYSDFTGVKLVKTYPIGTFKIGGIKLQINTAPTFSFTLAAQFDNFGEGYEIKMNNRIDFVVIDPDNEPEGTLMFTGYIYAYQPTIQGDKESIKVDCIGYLAKMAKSLGRVGLQISDLVTNGTGIDTSAVPMATATEGVFAAAITLYRTAYNTRFGKYPPINYAGTPGASTSSLQATSTTMTYTFQERYFLDILKDCLGCAPPGWFFTTDTKNVISFKAKPTTPTHTFTFIKDFRDISVLKNTDTSFNNTVFESANEFINLLKVYEDTTSEVLMDDRWEIKKDNNIVNAATADVIGNTMLSNNKDVKVKTQVVIIDNNVQDTGAKASDQKGFDIEKIKAGDTCSFVNFSDITSLTFTPNMLIASVLWMPESATLDLVEIPENTARDAVLAARMAQQAYGSSELPVLNSSNSAQTVGVVGATGSPAFLNSWVNYGSFWQGARFWKDASGYVHLEGLIKSGVIGTAAFTLPVGYAPPASVMFPTWTGTSTQSAGMVSVDSGGNVVPAFGNNTFMSLSGITFNTI